MAAARRPLWDKDLFFAMQFAHLEECHFDLCN